MSTERITAHFKMTRAVIDDAETAALEAANAHTFQIDGLSKQVAALTQENGELALEAARLTKGYRTACGIAERAEADLAHVRAEIANTLAVIEKATTEAASDQARESAAHQARMYNFVAEVDRAMGGSGCRAPEAVLSTAATLRLLAIEHQQNCAGRQQAAERVVYANVDTSLSDPRPGKLLVIRLDGEGALILAGGGIAGFARSQYVGWLESAQDEGDTETKAVDGDGPYNVHDLHEVAALALQAGRSGVSEGDFLLSLSKWVTDRLGLPENYGAPASVGVDVHHEGLPMPVVRCGECTATVGHFGDCVKAVQP